MGGGTSDMAMYRIVKEDGKDRITQITPNDGDTIGSHMLDHAFSEFVQKKYHLHNLGLHDNVEIFLQPLVSKFATKTKVEKLTQNYEEK
ncbi:hypothetical protein [Parasitella parasitica]|uniref:Uncharacterized protein n=1 Tax=Parasitella parasitica TaxID=35722 RepID=A0A0B7N3Y6_9FUNG|nr:hypothetical protein [Parasitella parasitica]